MFGRFKKRMGKLGEVVPENRWPLPLHNTFILASLIEPEAALPKGLSIIPFFSLNRLNRHILLQCDPTVIYALQQSNRYEGRLTLADLQFKSPYNTYVTPGLPPSAIANPGYPSLLAAIQPADTKYLFFVRTTDQRHTFSETLAAPNRALAAY